MKFLSTLFLLTLSLQVGAQEQVLTPEQLDAAIRSGQQPDPTQPTQVPPIEVARQGFSEPSLNIAPRAPTEDDAETIRRRELHDHKQRQRVAEHIAEGFQQPTNVEANASATLYEFAQDNVYVVYAGMGYVTDIQLAPGEQLLKAHGGDTARWSLERAESGAAANARTHVIVRPKYSGIRTNLILTTDRGSYHLVLRAVEDWVMPIVRWTYPADELAALTATTATATARETQSEPVNNNDPADLNYKFAIVPRGKRPKWVPISAFDDGLKTYLQMPNDLQGNDAPVFFVLDGKKPIVTAYRVKGSLYVIDRVFAEGELRVGTVAVRVIRNPRRRLFSIGPGEQ